MSKYSFSYNVNGYVVVDVEADNRYDAMDQADIIFNEMDFGPLEDVDGYMASVVTEDGSLYYESGFHHLFEDEENMRALEAKNEV